jgi:hypothetical protein
MNEPPLEGTLALTPSSRRCLQRATLLPFCVHALRLMSDTERQAAAAVGFNRVAGRFYSEWRVAQLRAALETSRVRLPPRRLSKLQVAFPSSGELGFFCYAFARRAFEWHASARKDDICCQPPLPGPQSD